MANDGSFQGDSDGDYSLVMICNMIKYYKWIIMVNSNGECPLASSNTAISEKSPNLMEVYSWDMCISLIFQRRFITRGYTASSGPRRSDALLRDLLVGGLEHQFYFPIYWVANHPN